MKPPASRRIPDPKRPKKRSLDPLRVIALFKFLKAIALIATGYGVHLLLNEAFLQRMQDWTETLTDSFVQRLLVRAVDWVQSLGATRIHIVMAITLAYTAVVLTEGIGLWMRRAWAEWLTTIATASLIPFELWELIVRPPSRKLAVAGTLLVNVIIVWYLTWLLRRNAAQHARVITEERHTNRRSTG